MQVIQVSCTMVQYLLYCMLHLQQAHLLVVLCALQGKHPPPPHAEPSLCCQCQHSTHCPFFTSVAASSIFCKPSSPSPSSPPLLPHDVALRDAGENGKALPARTGHSCTVLPENRLLIFGGMDDAGKYKNDMFLIDVKRLTWFKMPAKGAPPKGRAYHSWVPH